MELTLSGRVLTAVSDNDQKRIIDDVLNALKASAEKAIKSAFNRSIEVLAYSGGSMDPEVIKTIARSIKVDIELSTPPAIIARFSDDYMHWYESGEMPEDVAKKLQDILDSAIETWLRSPEVTETLVNILDTQ